MQDLISGDRRLSEFNAFVACGGFSYGDVLGAGEGWAKVILNNHLLKDQFEDFFTRKDTIALGVCNGCQMLSNIKTLIPGASSWPKLVRNYSDQFESRVVTVRVPRTNSIFFKDMENSFIPVITAHGEGRAEFKDQDDLNKLIKMEQITLQYVDNKHVVTEVFPFNPNGSLQGVTGFSNDDGRFNIMMPHPERVFRFDQQTWSRNKKDGYGAWFKFFTNAAYFIKNN
jgi:phosphoribosylformylglycinamidine synthase